MGSIRKEKVSVIVFNASSSIKSPLGLIGDVPANGSKSAVVARESLGLLTDQIAADVDLTMQQIGSETEIPGVYYFRSKVTLGAAPAADTVEGAGSLQPRGAVLTADFVIPLPDGVILMHCWNEASQFASSGAPGVITLDIGFTGLGGEILAVGDVKSGALPLALPAVGVALRPLPDSSELVCRMTTSVVNVDTLISGDFTVQGLYTFLPSSVL